MIVFLSLPILYPNAGVKKKATKTSQVADLYWRLLNLKSLCPILLAALWVKCWTTLHSTPHCGLAIAHGH